MDEDEDPAGSLPRTSSPACTSGIRTAATRASQVASAARTAVIMSNSTRRRRVGSSGRLELHLNRPAIDADRERELEAG